jgi:hypothetical protein
MLIQINIIMSKQTKLTHHHHHHQHQQEQQLLHDYKNLKHNIIINNSTNSTLEHFY